MTVRVLRLLFALASAVALALPVAAAPSPTDDDPELLARALLEEAEEKAAKGHYKQALSRYEKIVGAYPGTAAARVAELRVRPNALLGWADLVRTGPSENRVDVVIMGEGYVLRDLEKSFHSRADEMLDAFEREEALREYMPYFNFVRAGVVSAESGVDGYGREYDTALDGHVTSAIGERFAAVDGLRVQSFLDQLPSHDDVAIAIVDGETNGAPRGHVATVGGAKVEPEAVVHAWGHAFAGLGDEFTDTTNHRFDPGERPNVSLSETDVPWQHWIDARHPGVGVYRGAAGVVKGYWRPVASNCVMSGGRHFCPVCREALVLAIYGVVDGIDGATPAPHDYASDDVIEPEPIPTATARHEPVDFEVRTMRPETHALEIRWWVLEGHRAPKSRGVALSHEERRSRGVLPAIEAKPVLAQHVSRDGVYGFQLDPNDYEPGRYRVICRVVDTTEVRGERSPWVLSDPKGLLESERAWWVRVP